MLLRASPCLASPRSRVEPLSCLTVRRRRQGFNAETRRKLKRRRGEASSRTSCGGRRAEEPRTLGGGWRRAESGEPTGANAELHLGFESWEGMVRTLALRRLDLLRHVHRRPGIGVGDLALAVGRGCRRVQADVTALTEAGLLDGDADDVRAACDAVDVRLRIAP